MGLCVFVALSCILLVAGVQAEDHPWANGHLIMNDGSECTWFEMKMTATTTALTMSCTYKNAHGRTHPYMCQYLGEPAQCPSFERDPKDFLPRLAQHIASKSQSPYEIGFR